MTSFADQLTVRYMDPANVDLLLVPQADATRQRAQALLASVYEPRLLTVQSLDSITVTAKNFQVPVVEPVSVNGTWEKILPQSERSLVSFDLPALAQTDWIDMVLETTVTARVSATSEPLDMVTSEDVSELSQQDFLAKFQFLDLVGLMTAAQVSTYQELQADFPRLYHLHYATPPPYNPDDPGAKRTYQLRICVLFFSTLDLQAALRQLAQSHRAVDAVWPRPSEYEGGDLLASSAWIGVFPTSVFNLATTPITQRRSLCAIRRPRLGRGVREPVIPENAREEIQPMEDDTGASGSRARKPAPRKTRKGDAAQPGEEISSQELAADDERASPGPPVSDPTGPAPGAEALERLRNRLMAKHHGRRR